MGKARHQTDTDRIAVGTKNDRDSTGGLFGCKRGRCSNCYNDIDLLLHEVSRKVVQEFDAPLCIFAFDGNVLSLNITKFFQFAYEGYGEIHADTCIEQAYLEAMLGARRPAIVRRR